MKFSKVLTNILRYCRTPHNVCLPRGLIRPEDVLCLDDSEKLFVSMTVVWSRIQTIRYERTFKGKDCLLFAMIKKRYKEAMSASPRHVSRIQMSVVEIKTFFGRTDFLPLRTFRRDVTENTFCD